MQCEPSFDIISSNIFAVMNPERLKSGSMLVRGVQQLVQSNSSLSTPMKARSLGIAMPIALHICIASRATVSSAARIAVRFGRSASHSAKSEKPSSGHIRHGLSLESAARKASSRSLDHVGIEGAFMNAKEVNPELENKFAAIRPTSVLSMKIWDIFFFLSALPCLNIATMGMEDGIRTFMRFPRMIPCSLERGLMLSTV